MKKILFFAVLTIAFISANFESAAAQQQAANNPPLLKFENDVRSDRSVDDVYRRFANAYKAGNVEALVNVYKEDSRYFFPDNKLYHGRGQIRELYATFFENAKKAGENLIPTFVLKERQKAGNLSYDAAAFTIKVYKGAELVRQVEGNLVFVLEKVGNEWQIKLQTYHGARTK